MKTLIIFAHTFWEDSKVNKALFESIKNLKQVQIHNLSEIYKEGKIDVSKEMDLLKNADKIIFQFPLFWFSTLALLKEWQDRVLTAILYGENKELLKDKKFQIVTTLGGAQESYDGHHGATLEELLKPIYYTFEYLGCKSLKPFAIFSANANKLDLKAYQDAISQNSGCS
ncbi:flavodoxin family protein [Campylobacter coli]|uniref:NAD(P)H-dependent oxidoreductase n=1 Tax=Campylobacter coli TaxID=195 RepID=UPI002025FCE8|nr:NAD(P)H-dependent oxidoreductase [Campylobacter coli]EIL6659337.1 NAD(P)H-dependent oxidoreductase [Campylobacter coli]EIL6660170.1 NAD(P)H-dependent oxidoreductase [Campylobacter coli]WFB05364.1 flavodoxin family protein [Campylobacter coli]